MGVASAVLGWTPREFWLSTHHEFAAAEEIYVEVNSPKHGQR